MPLSVPPPRPTTAPPAQPERLNADELFRAGNEIEILHGEDVYRLRLTRNGKLILTK